MPPVIAEVKSDDRAAPTVSPTMMITVRPHSRGSATSGFMAARVW